MNNNYHVIIERDSEGFYVGSVPALPGCHTQARSLDELSERIKQAIALYLQAKRKRFVQKTYQMGVPLIDLTKANAIAAALEDDEILRKMAQGK